MWNPALTEALALTFACALLLYLYLWRFVVPLVKTNRLQYSLFALCGIIEAIGVLVAYRRSPDGLVALGLWPCTLLMFRLRPDGGPFASGTRRTLFWAHLTYFVLAMLFSALLLSWLTSQWPHSRNYPFEPPVFVFLWVPAVLTMMFLQQDLAVNFKHPSLFAGIVVSIAVVSFAATLTSWAASALVLKRCQSR